MKRLLVALFAVLLGLVLTGCGGSTPSQAKLSTAKLLTKARAYVKTQHDVSLSGRIDQGGAERQIMGKGGHDS